MKDKLSPRVLLIIELLCLVVLGALAAALIATEAGWLTNEPKNTLVPSSEERPRNDVNYSPSTAQDAVISEGVKTDSEESTTQLVPDLSLTTTLTRAEVKNGELSLGGIINAADFSGSCIFEVSDSSLSKETTTKALRANGSAGCAGSIDTGSLDQDKDWIVTLQAISTDGSTSTKDTAEILKADR